MSSTDALRALCFVAMPFGTKARPAGGTVDFDRVYEAIIRPAIEAAGMQPLRADEEQVGGIIHKPMFERLVLSEYVVADLTTANANVFYELGVRHAVRPFTTVPIMASDARLPFDLGPVRAIPYELDGSVPADPDGAQKALAAALEAAREHSAEDSPVFQLLDGFGAPDIERLRTDAFRDRVDYSHRIKQQLARARDSDDPSAEIATVREELGDIEDLEAGVAIDLYLSYRDTKDYEAMVALFERMPTVLKRTPLVREQLGFALNRLGRRNEAEQVLTELIDERGPSSETHGLLGRVYKDMWQDAVDAGKSFQADGFLKRAIDTYLAGFEADWRDAYPGINAVTLMELAEPPDERRATVAPVVAYSASRRIASGKPDYWDHATLFEAAVLADQREQAYTALRDALTMQRAPWEAETTLKNFRLIVEKRRARDDDRDWYTELDEVLADAASEPASG